MVDERRLPKRLEPCLEVRIREQRSGFASRADLDRLRVDEDRFQEQARGRRVR
jgi:hypothetical protein